MASHATKSDVCDGSVTSRPPDPRSLEDRGRGASLGLVVGVRYDNPLWRYFGYHDNNDRRNPRSLP
jgi:hypothetical protein